MILGIHHVTTVAGDAERAVSHYGDVLGLTLRRRTAERLEFSCGAGESGGLVVVEIQPGAAPGGEGAGGTHHFALAVGDREGLLKWKRRLTDHGVPVSGPLDRHYFESIYHRDPAGTVIEIATEGPGWTRDEAPDRIGTEYRAPPPEMLKGNAERERIQAETWPDPMPSVSPEMRFERLHHLSAIGHHIGRTHTFLHQGLGLRVVKRTSNFDMPDSAHWYWGVGNGAPGTLVTYFERPAARPVRMGRGQIAHYALAVAGEADLARLRARLEAVGAPVEELDGEEGYRGVATRDPDGQVVELVVVSPAPSAAEK